MPKRNILSVTPLGEMEPVPAPPVAPTAEYIVAHPHEFDASTYGTALLAVHEQLDAQLAELARRWAE